MSDKIMQIEISEHEKQWLLNQGAEMIASLGVTERSSVIDFGCGKGRYAIPLSQVVGDKGNVLAVERDSDEIADLRERIKAFGRQEAIRILNSEDVRLQSVDTGTIDSVFMFDVLQYIEDWDVFFESVHRVLKPGGSVNVYPAAVPHPGAVNIELVASMMSKFDLQDSGKKAFRMMHNKDMIKDEVYTFSLPN